MPDALRWRGRRRSLCSTCSCSPIAMYRSLRNMGTDKSAASLDVASRPGARHDWRWASRAPSVVLSQKHDVAVCRPAPFFCIITAVTGSEEHSTKGREQRGTSVGEQMAAWRVRAPMYLNGLFKSLSFLMQLSMICMWHGNGNGEGCGSGGWAIGQRGARTMEVHCLTFVCEYVAFSSTPSIDCAQGAMATSASRSAASHRSAEEKSGHVWRRAHLLDDLVDVLRHEGRLLGRLQVIHLPA